MSLSRPAGKSQARQEGGDVALILDNILSAAQHQTRKFTPVLAHNQSGYVLRFLLCRLWDQGRGKLVGAQVTLAQGTLAARLGLSRQWVHSLLDMLRQEGWIEYSAPRLDNGRRASCTFAIGRRVKHLLVTLKKSREKKRCKSFHVKEQWKFSPRGVREDFLRRAREEKLPGKETLARIPLLNQWLARGKGELVSNKTEGVKII